MLYVFLQIQGWSLQTNTFIQEYKQLSIYTCISTQHPHAHPHGGVEIQREPQRQRKRDRHRKTDRRWGGKRERGHFFSFHPHLTSFRLKVESGFLSEQVLSGSIHAQWEVRCCCVSEVPCYLLSSCLSLYQHDFNFTLWSVPEYESRQGHRNLGVAWYRSDDRKREHIRLFPSRWQTGDWACQAHKALLKLPSVEREGHVSPNPMWIACS